MERRDFIEEVDQVLAALRRVLLRAFEHASSSAIPQSTPAVAPQPKPAMTAVRAVPAKPLRPEPVREPVARPATIPIGKTEVAPVSWNGVDIDFERETVSYVGRTVTVTFRQAQLVAVLARAMPHHVDRQEAGRRAWPDLSAASQNQMPYSMRVPLKQRMAEIGLSFELAAGFGLRLWRDEPSQSEAAE